MGRLLLVALAFAAGAGATYLWLDEPRTTASIGGIPVIRQHDPEPGTPPVVWVSGRLVSVEGSRLTVREGEGPELVMRRFAQGATSFHRLENGAWLRLDAASIGAASGQAACVEALLDDGELLALRVFVGAGCSPVP